MAIRRVSHVMVKYEWLHFTNILGMKILIASNVQAVFKVAFPCSNILQICSTE